MKNKELVLRDYLYKSISKEEIDQLAPRLARFIDLCLEEYNTLEEIKLIDYVRGLLAKQLEIKNPMEKDYLLTDFIKSSGFIISPIRVSRDLFSRSIMYLPLDFNDESINDNPDIKFNIYKEFVFLTEISKFNREFVREIVRKLEFRNMDRRFLRILSLYSAIYCLELRIRMEEEESVEARNDLNDRINYLIESFDDFTQFTPSWLR